MHSSPIKISLLAAVSVGCLSSAAFSQAGGYARFTRSTDTIRILGNTTFAQGDFTYEARIRFEPESERGNIVWEQRDGTEDKNLQLGPNGDYLASGCAGPIGNISGNIGPIPAEEWIHVAYVHEGAALKLYVDGILRLTRTYLVCYGDDPNSWMSIGLFRQQGGPDRPSFRGDLDWIRISSGARYTGEFSPSYECELVADQQTQLLLKLNEPAGTMVLVDESGSHFTCQLGVHVQSGASATSPTLGNTAGGFPICGLACPGDITGGGVVDAVDLAAILGRWGTNPKDYPRADTNQDSTVDATDLSVVLAGWGKCP
jgi:hypothetical protein